MLNEMKSRILSGKKNKNPKLMKGVSMKKKICLLASLIFLLTVMCVTQLEADWTYKRPIEINNGGGALTDYQVLVTLTTAIMGDPYTHVNTDGSDIRFSTGDNVDPLPYCIESWDNTGTSKIWVKATNIGTGTTTPFNMYYGNSGGSSEGNGTNTFEFFDDFDDGDISDWTLYYTHPGTIPSVYSASYHSPAYSIEAGWYGDGGGSTMTHYAKQTVSLPSRLYKFMFYSKHVYYNSTYVPHTYIDINGSQQINLYGSIWDWKKDSFNFDGEITEIKLRWTWDGSGGSIGQLIDDVFVCKYADPEPGATVGNESGGDYTLPVELSVFTAQYLNNVPTLYWVTQSETDNIGWYVYRNTENDFEDANRISGFIDGYGTTTEPHHYIYEDVELNGIPGEAYWYWIESVDLGGAFHRYSPAVLNIPDISHPNPYQNIPKQYGLHQNNPNPLSMRSSSTRISFLLPKTSTAEVKIYNIRGELVKDLYNGIAYGDDEVKLTWDGRDENGVAQVTGIYLYQLKVNGKPSETKRLILLR